MINLYIIEYENAGTNGIVTYVNELKNILKRSNNIQLHFIWIKSIKYIDIKKESDDNGIIHYHIPRDIAVAEDMSSYDVKVADFLAKEMKGMKYVVIHFNWINHCPFAHLIKQRVNCKTLLTKHTIPWRDFIFSDYPLFIRFNQILTNGQSILSPIMHPALVREKVSYNLVDHIICVSHCAHSSLEKLLRIPANKMSVIYNGIESKFIESKKGNKNILRKKYGFQENVKIILFAGSIVPRKGIADFIPIFEKIVDQSYPHDVRLVIAGVGEYNVLFSKMKRYWSKIIMTGVLNKETLYDFYTMADIGIAPSYIEQCSYTVIEMMHFGLPVVVSDIEGLSEIVPEDGGLKVKVILGSDHAQVDPEAFQEKILYVLENPGLAKKYAENAKKYALENFNTNEMAIKTLAVYGELIKQNSPRQYFLRTLTKKYDNKLPLVSIVLPCFNGEKYLLKCINSILNQRYPFFELIIINDASNDNTKKIIKDLRDNRIIYIENEENLGISQSLNKAIKIAKGKYLARMDADDIMHQERLVRQVIYLEEHKDISIVGSNNYIIDANDRVISLMEFSTFDKELRFLMLFNLPFLHSSIMARTALLKKFKYSNRYKYCEGHHLWFKITAHHSVGNIPEYLISSRIHENSISNQNAKQQQQNILELLSTELDKLGINHSGEELAIHAAIYFKYGRVFFNSYQKLVSLESWLDKIFIRLKTHYSYDDSFIQKMRDFILDHYCGINGLIEKNIH